MKIVVFLILLFFLFIPAGFFFSFVAKGVKGTKNDEWQGEVVDKLYNTRREGNNKNEYFSIVFKTDKGERKIAVSKMDYHKWQIGDKARKVKGEFGVIKA